MCSLQALGLWNYRLISVTGYLGLNWGLHKIIGLLRAGKRVSTWFQDLLRQNFSNYEHSNNKITVTGRKKIRWRQNKFRNFFYKYIFLITLLCSYKNMQTKMSQLLRKCHKANCNNHNKDQKPLIFSRVPDISVTLTPSNSVGNSVSFYIFTFFLKTYTDWAKLLLQLQCLFFAIVYWMQNTRLNYLA